MTRVKILGTKDFDTKFKAKGNFQVDLPPSTYPFPLKPKTVKNFGLNGNKYADLKISICLKFDVKALGS